MLEKEKINFLNQIDKCCVHGKSILAKSKNDKILPFFEKYQNFYNSINQLTNENIKEKSKIFIEYKNKIHSLNNQNGRLIFSAQSKLEPTIIEEFLFHLFKDIVHSNSIINVGSVKAYNNLYFSPSNFQEFKENNFIKINQKDQDFSIYKTIILKDNQNQEYKLSVPIVSIECKTYLDKTMLEGSIATAEKVKSGNPHCKFYILTETYEVDLKVDPSTSRIDNIFVLKKGNRSERTSEIKLEVIKSIYEEVNNHLNSNWRDIESNIKNKGSVY